MPKSVKPVSNFELDRYLGKWYEIARLDHSFERGLSQVTAEYSMRNDGGVRVLNRGYSDADSKWKEAEGKAYFVKRDSEGYVKNPPPQGVALNNPPIGGTRPCPQRGRAKELCRRYVP